MKRAPILIVALIAVIAGLVCFELFSGQEQKADVPRCGDGKLDIATEQCDDGNKIDDDKCSNTCRRTKARCGDGKVQRPKEECDDGNLKSGDGCSPTCQREKGRCGNGIVEHGEACDDGNNNERDGCDTLCRKTGAMQDELCGNGQIDPGERCDDGNRANGDGCSRDCDITNEGPWFTETCNSCMKEQCDEISTKCLGDSSCVDAMACTLQNACLSPTVGPLSCYCGNIGAMACRDPKNDPVGPCIREMEQGLGTRDKQTIFTRFIDESRAMGRANKTLVCLARKCREPCSLLFGGDPNVM